MNNTATKIEPSIHLELCEIAVKMKKDGLPIEFISNAITTAMEYEGVYDLVKIWETETDKHEKELTIADIQDLINDCQEEFREEPYIKFDDLEKIAKNIRKFKDRLLVEVNSRGGITKLSQLTDIPQPSLSRFFNSNSMPRRSTLLKIAAALKLDALTIATEWDR